MMGGPSCSAGAAVDATFSEQLNRGCFCITLDRPSLEHAIAAKSGEPEFWTKHLASRPNLFSNVPLFLPAQDLAAMREVVEAIGAVSRLPVYRERVLSHAPEIARADPGPLGVFMGYDFHLTPDGPKLIEINTNAGGAFLNALLVEAQRGCCPEIENHLMRAARPDFEAGIVSMFRNEWRLQNKSGALHRIAIVDDAPEEQYLFPEFVLAQRLLEKHGFKAAIADAAALRYEGGRLLAGGEKVDLVYNRLVDFPLAQPEHEALRLAYRDGAVAVTPNPHVHALFADKRNMALFSDQALLRRAGLAEEMIARLGRIPRTVLVEKANEAEMWEGRRKLFFKPAGGHGSKAVYRGDKLTKRVWEEIRRGNYVAQDLASPSERMVPIDGTSEARKADIRLYVYDQSILMIAARLYQGQTTNFRTAGGGFAAVFEV